MPAMHDLHRAVFLLQLLIIIAFLLCEVVLQTNLLSYPYKWVLHQVLPDIYPEDADVRVHPYFASGLLFVSVTTLVLFFASGMYAEKIDYANRCVLFTSSAPVALSQLARNAWTPSLLLCEDRVHLQTSDAALENHRRAMHGRYHTLRAS